MSIKQLRAAIAPCCGLGANREEVDAALNSVSAQLSTQEQLLVETLNILEHSLKAIRLDAMTEELLQNHYSAIKAIREALNYQEVLGLPCAVTVSDDSVTVESLRMPMLNVPPRQFASNVASEPIQVCQIDEYEWSSLYFDKLREMVSQPGPLQLMPKVASSQIDQIIHNLFSTYWVGSLSYGPIKSQRSRRFSR